MAAAGRHQSLSVCVHAWRLASHMSYDDYEHKHQVAHVFVVMCIIVNAFNSVPEVR